MTRSRRSRKKAGEDAKFLYLSKYGERAGSLYDKGTTVALIYGVGGVMRGKSGYDPVFQEVTMGADTVAAAFRAAVDDKKVKAILFRIDSHGRFVCGVGHDLAGDGARAEGGQSGDRVDEFGGGVRWLFCRDVGGQDRGPEARRR